MSEVRPALLELEELVEEKRLRTQFAATLPGGSVLGVAVTDMCYALPWVGGRVLRAISAEWVAIGW